MPITAALGRRPSSRRPLCWSSCFGTRRASRLVRWKWSSGPVRRWRAVACTTSWPAASRGTASTTRGWCRTSKRCCTTTLSWCGCMRIGGGRPARRWRSALRSRPPQFLLADLRTDEGGFASALDADTEGVEGSTYVWNRSQLLEVLGVDDATWAAELTLITRDGTFEHGRSVCSCRSIQRTPTGWAAVRNRLRAARDRRPAAGSRRQGCCCVERAGDRRISRSGRAV